MALLNCEIIQLNFFNQVENKKKILNFVQRGFGKVCFFTFNK